LAARRHFGAELGGAFTGVSVEATTADIIVYVRDETLPEIHAQDATQKTAGVVSTTQIALPMWPKRPVAVQTPELNSTHSSAMSTSRLDRVGCLGQASKSELLASA
jgi:hypothetical protein